MILVLLDAAVQPKRKERLEYLQQQQQLSPPAAEDGKHQQQLSSHYSKTRANKNGCVLMQMMMTMLLSSLRILLQTLCYSCYLPPRRFHQKQLETASTEMLAIIGIRLLATCVCVVSHFFPLFVFAVEEDTVRSGLLILD